MKLPGNEKKEESPEKREVRRKELLATIERLAREAEPEALARRGTIMTEAAAEYEKQAAGFAFECSKWGSFLRIATTRLGNPFTGKYKAQWAGGPGQSFSTSLNLENITTITLEAGHLPDLNGELGYSVSMEREDGQSFYGVVSEDSEWTPKIHARYPYVPPSRQHFMMDEVGEWPGGIECGGGYQVHFRTPQYVRVSTDDRIVFAGMRATLFVPAGRGEAILNEILSAT